MKYCYKIALVNYLFDASYENVRYFDTDTARDAYFDAKITSWQSLGVNFNAGDLFETVQNIRVPEYGNLINLLSKNYAVVQRQTCDDDYKNPVDDNTAPRLYYFVKRSTQRVGGSIDIQLELDVIMTFINSVNIAPALIERAHLPRFIKDGNKYKFNATATSPLYERESVKSIAQRLTSRVAFEYQINTNSVSFVASQFNEWIRDNVLAWVYIYLSPTKVQGYKQGDGTDNTSEDLLFIQYVNNNAPFNQPYAVLCYPIMKTDKKLKILTKVGTVYKSYDISNLFGFERLKVINQELEAKLLTIKISSLPPFPAQSYEMGEAENTAFQINPTTGNLEMFAKYNGDAGTFDKVTLFVESIYTGGGYGVLNVTGQAVANGFYSQKITLDKQSFTKAEITGARSRALNPKLLSADVKTLRVSDGTAFFDYDVQKLGKDEVRFIITEPFSPDITRHYIRVAPEDTGEIYNPAQAWNFFGLTSSQDTTLPFSVNGLSTFLANNKNFYLQRSIKTAAAAGKAAGSFVGNLLTGQWGAAVGNIMDGANIALERINSNLTLDNMANAPETVNGANGNAALIAAVTETQIYIEQYAALEVEQRIADDFTYKNGYNFGELAKPSEYYATRKYFNYIQAIIDVVDGDIPETVHDKMKAIFARGVRLWHTDTVEYNLENYERSLDNE